MLSASLSQWEWYRGFFWGAPAAGILLLGLWRGRFFCRWVCPAGTLYAFVGGNGRKKQIAAKDYF